MIPRAKRLEAIRGFGIDRVAAAAEEPARASRALAGTADGEPRHRPAAATRGGARHRREPGDAARRTAGCPFTGDLDLRAAIADFTAERTGHRYDPEREIVITCGGMEGLLTPSSSPSTPATR